MSGMGLSGGADRGQTGWTGQTWQRCAPETSSADSPQPPHSLPVEKKGLQSERAVDQAL